MTRLCLPPTVPGKGDQGRHDGGSPTCLWSVKKGNDRRAPSSPQTQHSESADDLLDGVLAVPRERALKTSDFTGLAVDEKGCR